ncbi:MAG: hypothetical protein Terrestrivirus3_179 [Terrestrivirus sp.]|uniref:Uncharacterized protein n=1 Tax=Terrestrivirus sp. TaxID=2487775 RepID=A0A3G4ZM22_9VIRU|nr:MAG: hypothetical protein Terrestrivirus3_179 [Terrestrivirus sp.]
MNSLTDSQGVDLAEFNQIDTPDDVNYDNPFIQTTQNKSKQLINKSVIPTKQDKYMEIIDQELIPEMTVEYKHTSTKLVTELIKKHNMTEKDAKDFIKQYNKTIGHLQLDLHINEDAFDNIKSTQSKKTNQSGGYQKGRFNTKS